MSDDNLLSPDDDREGLQPVGGERAPRPRGVPGRQPEYELTDLETMPKVDEAVVKKDPKPYGQNQRNFLLIMLMIALAATLTADLLGAALIDPERWEQFHTEVEVIRTWLFFTLGPIVGYFYAKNL